MVSDRDDPKNHTDYSGPLMYHREIGGRATGIKRRKKASKKKKTTKKMAKRRKRKK